MCVWICDECYLHICHFNQCFLFTLWTVERIIFQYGNIMLLNKDNGSHTPINNYYAKNNIIPSHILEVNDMDMLIELAKPIPFCRLLL